jgi:CrcB protein
LGTSPRLSVFMSIPVFHILLVLAGGGIGSVLRYIVNLWTLQRFGPHFPWGTLTVNIVGSAIMGLLAATIMIRWTPEGGGNELRLFLMTGVLGGFTTFSAFSLDAMILFERGEMLTATGYVLASVLGSILALGLAMAATRALLLG